MQLRVLVLSLSCLLCACLRGEAPNREAAHSLAPGEVELSRTQAESARLSVATVGLGEVNNRVTASGRISFDALRVAHVFSPVNGRVTQISAELGARVRKGDALAVIDSPDLGLTFADVDKARADTIAAQHEWQRQRELLAAHASAEREMETAQDNYHKALAEQQRAEQKARLLVGGAARERSTAGVTQTYVLRAAIDGEVVARNVNPGTEVQGQYSGGAAVELFTLGELDRVWALADVFEMDVGRIQVGSQAQVKVVSYPDRVFDGHIDWISGTIDPAAHTAKVRCTLDNSDHLLKPDMYATVTLAAIGPRRLVVPRTAVLRLGEQSVVFLLTGEAGGTLRYQRRPVMVDDEFAGELVPVLHGLKPGEKVVSSGAILLSTMD